MCSDGCAICRWVIAGVLDHPGASAVEIGRETPIFIGRSRPFSPAGGPGVGGGWSCDGASCSPRGGLECDTQWHRLTGHTVALEITDGGYISIFDVKIATDPPSVLSGSPCGGARGSPKGSSERPDGKLHFDM